MIYRIRTAGVVLLLLLMVGGCAPLYLNQRKNDLKTPIEQRASNSNPQTESFLEPVLTAEVEDQPRAKVVPSAHLSPNGYFVGLAISGGGSRSANFAAACMFQLQRIGLLQKVQCVSSVSGGSLIAAYYCSCTDAEWNPKNVQEKLSRSFESTVVDQVLTPWNIIGLLNGSVNRSDLLANEFDAALFKRKDHLLTFADLRRDRPRLLINSTDMQSGRGFLFDNSTFDLLNSDLDKYSVSHAVAASSAVPAVLDPVTLQDYSTNFNQYNHLVDGGVVDNLGVQTLVNSYAAERQKADNPYPNGAILVVIDAGTPVSTKLNSKAVLGGVENLTAGLDVSSSILLHRTGLATLSDILVMHSLADYKASELRSLLARLREDHYVEIRDKTNRRVRIVHLSLAQVAELTNLSFATSVATISTKYDITQTEAYNLYRAAEILFQSRFDARLKPLVEELNQHTAPTTMPVP
jgi:predicted acylesterase/phospholipase RssA